MIMHVLSGEWPLPKAAVEVGPQNELIPLSEFDRRKDYIKDSTVAECPLIDLLKSCLSNSSSHRPTSSEIHRQVSAVAVDHPPSFANRVEMLERIKALEQAKDEREAEARNAKQDTSNLKDINHELGSHSSQPLSDTRHLDRQIKEMESINKELVASCELASQQLSARREKMKRQQTRIEELEKELDEALQENAELKNVHDNMLHSNTEALDKLQTLLDEKLKTIVELQDLVQCLEKEKAELKDTVHQLSDQLASLKEVKMTGHTCAICQTNFHERISEIEFQSHIISHYQDLGRQNEDMKSINKELVASCEVANQQLSARKKEMKKQQTRIKELEKELDQAKHEIAAGYRTCPVCQTKFPLRISKCDFDNHVRCHFENDGPSAHMKSINKELVASCEVASQHSSARKTHIEKLEKELDQAKHEIREANRTCPVCQTKFPRVSQADFERHVQGHFDAV